MRRYFKERCKIRKVNFFFGLSIFLLTCTACGKSNEDPGIIKIGKESLSYMAAEVPDIFFEKEIEFVFGENNQIRRMTISDSEVETYMGIKVGDSINKVQSKYEHEMEFNNANYMVLFDDTNEIDPTIKEKKDNYLWINYHIDDNGNIDKIDIYDFKCIRRHPVAAFAAVSGHGAERVASFLNQ